MRVTGGDQVLWQAAEGTERSELCAPAGSSGGRTSLGCRRCGSLSDPRPAVWSPAERALSARQEGVPNQADREAGPRPDLLQQRSRLRAEGRRLHLLRHHVRNLLSMDGFFILNVALRMLLHRCEHAKTCCACEAACCAYLKRYSGAHVASVCSTLASQVEP